MIELSRTQDEEVGDGTTSVIVLGMYFTQNMIQLFMKPYAYCLRNPVLGTNGTYASPHLQDLT